MVKTINRSKITPIIIFLVAITLMICGLIKIMDKLKPDPMVILFENLSLRDSNNIMQIIKDMHIKARVVSDGTAIYVPYVNGHGKWSHLGHPNWSHFG